MERGVLALGWLRADRLRRWPGQGRLVFVCSGNICRSPYAQEVARRHGIAAVSCGIDTNNGLPADSAAMRTAAQRGVDLSAHRTTKWEDLVVATGDVIVAMQLKLSPEDEPTVNGTTEQDQVAVPSNARRRNGTRSSEQV